MRGKSFTTSSLLILQDGNVAKARGCSGAIRVAYPSFFLLENLLLYLSDCFSFKNTLVTKAEYRLEIKRIIKLRSQNNSFKILGTRDMISFPKPILIKKLKDIMDIGSVCFQSIS